MSKTQVAHTSCSAENMSNRFNEISIMSLLKDGVQVMGPETGISLTG